MDRSQCLACAVNERRVQPPGGFIVDEELWVADHELGPLMRGYLIIKPRRHVHYFADLSDEEAISYGPTLRRVLNAMTVALHPERIYVCSFAETVHHLHFHLIPRYADMPALGPDLLHDVFAGRWATDAAIAEQAAADIRAGLIRA